MNIKQHLRIVNSTLFLSTLLIGIGLSAIQPRSAHGAEEVKLIYGPFNGRISVKSLEKYAKTGEIDSEFKLYSKFVDRETLVQLKYWLNNRFESDRVEMYRFTNAPEGEKFLQELGTVIKTHKRGNGFYALRSSLIAAADVPGESDGWTVMEAMHNFPTEDLQIDTKKLFKLQKFWSKNQTHQAALKMFNPQKEE